jgi:hypothetical protein
VKTEEYNEGISLRVLNATFEDVARSVSEVPGVVFTKQRKSFRFGRVVGGEFTLRGHTFQIYEDEWEDGHWILSQDHQKHLSEMQELRDAVGKYYLPPPQGGIIGIIKDIFTKQF